MPATPSTRTSSDWPKPASVRPSGFPDQKRLLSARVLLFQKRFLPGLVSGAITLTFRAWQSAKVKPGGRYRCHPIGVLEVDEVSIVTATTITEADARDAGFVGLPELMSYLAEVRPGVERGDLFRIRLHYAGDGNRVAVAMDGSLTAADKKAIRDKLSAMDARSEVGPWTAKLLSLIAKHPRIAASKLAAKVSRDTPSFKADVVKLKKLGLTQSFEVGYELTPRGRAYRGKPSQ